MSQKSIPRTTFRLALPIGLLDDDGTLHKEGVIRLATGKDELWLQQDPHISDNPAYGVLVMLSRVILRLGDLSTITPELLEGLFLVDLQHLQEFYNLTNPREATLDLLGESSATPRRLIQGGSLHCFPFPLVERRDTESRTPGTSALGTRDCLSAQSPVTKFYSS